MRIASENILLNVLTSSFELLAFVSVFMVFEAFSDAISLLKCYMTELTGFVCEHDSVIIDADSDNGFDG
jgi:hypothetical protein